MSAPDYYELYLLGLARESAEKQNCWLTVYPKHPDGGYYVEVATGIDGDPTPPSEGHAPTLEASLRALLDDLGVEYAERPSAVRVERVRTDYALGTPCKDAYYLNTLRDLYARSPLIVLALLAGEA